jgi:alkylresorcinol/alkylpyrone synthase
MTNRQRSSLAPRVPRSAAERAAPALISVATALPPYSIGQADGKTFAEALFGEALGRERRRLLEVFDHSGVETRQVCMPLDWYRSSHDFSETNALYIERGLELALAAARDALAQAGLGPQDVDHVVFVSSTGIATPSLDARMANRLGFREDVRRTPIWGLGCAGGAVGLARARDFALADPRARVLLVTLELCTLTFQRGDLDRRNLVAASLFSDGAAAAVVCGAEARAESRRAIGRHRSTTSPSMNGWRLGNSRGESGDGDRRPAGRGLELLASRSTLWPDTLDVMGWEVDQRGLHVVFSRDIPTIVRQWVRPNIDAFLAQAELDLAAIAHVIAHPGGPKVLAAYAESLDVPIETFRHAREILRTRGNMSSPTCLFVLERAIAHGDLAPGDLGLIAALGPGFSSEYVLVRAG